MSRGTALPPAVDPVGVTPVRSAMAATRFDRDDEDPWLPPGDQLTGPPGSTATEHSFLQPD